LKPNNKYVYIYKPNAGYHERVQKACNTTDFFFLDNNVTQNGDCQGK